MHGREGSGGIRREALVGTSPQPVLYPAPTWTATLHRGQPGPKLRCHPPYGTQVTARQAVLLTTAVYIRVPD